MIYYTNVDLDVPHMTFIGRWTPFHKGHKSIIETKRNDYPELPIMIQIRSTNYDDYPPHVRAEFIKAWMVQESISGTIMIVPDIQGVYYGRGVGYQIEQIQVDKEIEDISATKIRRGISGDDQVDWQNHVATKEIANLLNPNVARMIDSGHVVWLTGCPCAGKTTIAKGLAEKVKIAFPQLRIQMLDGDVMRDTPIAQQVGFSKQDRAEHILRMGYLSKMFADHGILVIASFVSPDRKVRGHIRRIIGKTRFSEIYVKASKKERMKRDVKGMYARAKAGEIDNFTGFNAPYDAPKNPLCICNTEDETEAVSVDKVFNQVFAVAS